MPSEIGVLPKSVRQDIRASYRTFEGTYARAFFSEISLALLILRLFAKEYVPVALVLTIHAILNICFALYHSFRVEREFEASSFKKFITGGRLVAINSAFTIGSYIALIIIIARV